MRTRLLLCAAALLLSSAALADRQEFYVVPTFGPELLRMSAPTHGSMATKPTLGFSLSGFYGLTNSLHAGVALHYASLANVPFDRTSATLTDGSQPTGTLYSDSSLYGATVFALYRLNMPSALVPVFKLGVGPVIASYKNLALFPEGTQFQIAQPDQSEVGFATQLSVGAQYRLGNHFLASAALEVRRNFGTHTPWEYALPISAGYVW
jgi:hypothetical protein